MAIASFILMVHGSPVPLDTGEDTTTPSTDLSSVVTEEIHARERRSAHAVPLRETANRLHEDTTHIHSAYVSENILLKL